MWKQISVHKSMRSKIILCALKSGLLTVKCEMEVCLTGMTMIEMSFLGGMVAFLILITLSLC